MCRELEQNQLGWRSGSVLVFLVGRGTAQELHLRHGTAFASGAPTQTSTTGVAWEQDFAKLRALHQLADQLPSSSRHWIECGQLAIRNGRLHWRDLLLLFRKYTKRGGKGVLSLTNIGIDDEVVAHAGGDSVARRPLPCGGTVLS